MHAINMVEPTDPEERKAAIRICRANCYLHPDTGERVEDREESQRLWRAVCDDLPYRKWIWMWNHGRSEWDPRYSTEGKRDE